MSSDIIFGTPPARGVSPERREHPRPSAPTPTAPPLSVAKPSPPRPGLAQHQLDPRPFHGRSGEGPVGTPRHPDGARPGGVRAVDPLPPPQSAEPGLGRSRPLRALLRPRLDAALLAAASRPGTTCRSRKSRSSGSGAPGPRDTPSGDTRRGGDHHRSPGTGLRKRSRMAIAERFSPGISTAPITLVDHRTWVLPATAI